VGRAPRRVALGWDTKAGAHVSSENALPRLLTLMGSGETSPTMVKVHRSILERLGPRPVPAVLLDTPFGFQENANELSIRVKNYFDESLQTIIANASGIDPEHRTVDDERFINEQLTLNIRHARYVFSGPGSPTYALRKWENTIVPQLLTEKLREGGAITFASAAALTLGALTVPVYEIYKVGEDPHWLPGLNVTLEGGLKVAVIPHYNNAEGGTHDTRFCYLGERRLQLLEEQMPEDYFVLGIDEHTSCMIDLDSGLVTVGGIGLVSVRKSGHTTTYTSGANLTVDQLIDTAMSGRTPSNISVSPKTETTPAAPERERALLLDLVQEAEQSFQTAVSANNAPDATAIILDLEQSIHDWSSDSAGQDEMARSRASLRSMITEFGKIAVQGLEDPAMRIAPYIELLITRRSLARANRRFEEADEIRDQLLAIGIELRDSAEKTTWTIGSAS